MSDRKKEKNPQGVTLSRGMLIILLVAVLLLVTGGIALGMNWNRWFGPDTAETEPFVPDIDPDAGDLSDSRLTEKAEEEAVGIKIPGYPSISLPADQKDARVALLNPEGNPCYFTFELVLRETGEVLYTSKQVPPGQMISDITLSRALSAGEYDAAIRISTASLEDGSAMNGANVETVLIVQ